MVLTHLHRRIPFLPVANSTKYTFLQSCKFYFRSLLYLRWRQLLNVSLLYLGSCTNLCFIYVKHIFIFQKYLHSNISKRAPCFHLYLTYFTFSFTNIYSLFVFSLLFACISFSNILLWSNVRSAQDPENTVDGR